jgi:hypothetical protein
MDNKALSVIGEGGDAEVLQVLQDFNLRHETHKGFKDMSHSTKQELWDSIFSRLKIILTTTTTATVQSDGSLALLKACLNSLRLLSREKAPLEQAMTDDRIKLLLEISGLLRGTSPLSPNLQPVEGLKVIFNMIFQSQILQIMFITEGLLECLVRKVEDFNSADDSRVVDEDYKYFTLRIFFLITALCSETAPPKVRSNLQGLCVMNDFLEKYLRPPSTTPISLVATPLATDILCEALKVTYNLIHDLSPSKRASEADIDKDDMDQIKRLTRNVRLFLLFPSEVSTKDMDIRRHSVDLLAAIPPSCFIELVPKIEGGGSGDTQLLFENNDCSAIESAVQYLDARLDVELSKGPNESSDSLAPPLCALHNMACSARPIRKYLKLRILPPLSRRDVINLPEVGNTIRNKLCSLLTSRVSHITELVANFLFVLCKESVRKMVKYTGYGNAAGLLANRGLMLGGKPPAGKYSDSEEESSDTEDYKEVEHLINQVEGRIQLDRPDPMEGMTDAQKEAEAMKLINAIDKMERNNGLIKPCRIGSDGRPVPIEHVMQLQEALENPIKSLRRNDSDSDSD